MLKLFQPSTPSTATDRIQRRYLIIATLFLFIYSVALTLSPMILNQRWNVALRWNHWIGFAGWLAFFALLHLRSCTALPERDPYLIPVAGLLSGWGLLTNWRLSSTDGLRQTIWLVICLAAILLLVSFKENLLLSLRRYKYIWISIGLILTALTFIFGTYPGGNGPHLWLGCCGIYFQPSELLKLLLIIYLAAFFADSSSIRFRSLEFLLPTLLVIGTVMFMLIAQKDLGTSIIFVIIYTTILYISTKRKRLVLLIAVFCAIAALLGYHWISIIQLRVNTWLNPWADPLNSSYQIVQSLIAIATGGIFGKGPGLGNPTLIPVVQSDFIFSAIGEESGLLGTAGLIILIAFLILHGFQIALRASDLYQRFLATGVTIYLGAQSLLIIGGNLNLLPLTGITLPFVSYGGSSLVSSFFALLILLLISNQPEHEPVSLPDPHPYMQIGGVLMIGFSLALLLNGWWAVWSSQSLIDRSDNLRKSLNSIYVNRGSIVDRSGEPLVQTEGVPGSYASNYLYPPLSPVLGYSDVTYGQAGLEASLDSLLRGVSGDSRLSVLWNQILYGQPTQGLNVRLSISLSLQKQADTLLSGNKGAIIMVNASTGEILVLSSYPYADSNTLDKNWSTIKNDKDAPLLDRATMGQYPAGTTLGAFLLAQSGTTSLPALSSSLGDAYTLGKAKLACSFTKTNEQLTWSSLISAGCPQALLALTASNNQQDLQTLYTKLGLYTTPQINLQVADAQTPTSISNLNAYRLGQTGISISPLQMALAAATLSSSGSRPTPILTMAEFLSDEGWKLLPELKSANQVFSSANTTAAVQMLEIEGSSGWETIGTANTSDNQPITWYIGGTLPSWQGSPIAIAVLLEQNNPKVAQAIGESLLRAAQNP